MADTGDLPNAQLPPEDVLLFTMQTLFAASAMVISRASPILSDNPYSTAMIVGVSLIVLSSGAALIASHTSISETWKQVILQTSGLPILSPSISLWLADFLRALAKRLRKRTVPGDVDWDRDHTQRITRHMLPTTTPVQVLIYVFTAIPFVYSLWRFVVVEAWFGFFSTILCVLLTMVFPGLPGQPPEGLTDTNKRIENTRIRPNEWVIPVLDEQPLTSGLRFKVHVGRPVVGYMDGPQADDAINSSSIDKEHGNMSWGIKTT